MPGPRHALKDRREAVHRDQRSGSAGLPPPVELGFDPIMVWPENLAYACDLLAFTQPHISWYWRELADFQDRRLRARRAVAVDDKARIVLLHQGGVERVRDHAAEPGDADVPGDVALALGFRNAELTECARHGIARVIGDDQERRPAVLVVHRDRRRLVGRQQAIRDLVHWCAHALESMRGVFETRAPCSWREKCILLAFASFWGCNADSHRQARSDISLQATVRFRSAPYDAASAGRRRPEGD